MVPNRSGPAGRTRREAVRLRQTKQTEKGRNDEKLVHPDSSNRGGDWLGVDGVAVATGQAPARFIARYARCVDCRTCGRGGAARPGSRLLALAPRWSESRGDWAGRRDVAV